MSKHQQLKKYIDHHADKIGKVVYFDTKRHNLLPLDLTGASPEPDAATIASTFELSDWIFKTLKEKKSKYYVGGYFENRLLYANRDLFNTAGEPRTVHLGIDIWGDAGTMVSLPMEGIVHSFQDNKGNGNYGPTIILEHDLDGLKLYSLYGHLNEESLLGLYEGLPIKQGETLGEIGAADENGNWPPHLHFQLMFDMQGKKGDYPGACRVSEKEAYLQNIPDPNLILQFPATAIINQENRF